MNKKQRIILSVGILLVIFNGLFPPYEGELRQKVSMFSSHIITSRVWIQVVTVVVATLGLLFLVAGKDNKGFSKKPDIGRRTQSQNKGIIRIFKKLSDPNRLFTLLCLNPYPHSRFGTTKQAYAT
jgi:hypothetical protein